MLHVVCRGPSARVAADCCQHPASPTLSPHSLLQQEKPVRVPITPTCPVVWWIALLPPCCSLPCMPLPCSVSIAPSVPMAPSVSMAPSVPIAQQLLSVPAYLEHVHHVGVCPEEDVQACLIPVTILILPCSNLHMGQEVNSQQVSLTVWVLPLHGAGCCGWPK